MTRYLLLISFLVTTLAVFSQDVIIPAEFEKNEGIILKWNYNTAIDSAVSEIAAIISTDNKVWILFDPANTTPLSSIQSQLTLQGTNLSNTIFIEGTAENPWLRDYGPVAGYYVEDSIFTRHFADAQYAPAQFPLADFLPLQLASDFSFNYEAMPLNIEGGNLLLDGIGRGYVSDRILTQNPDLNLNQIIQTLYSKLNLNEIIILPSIPECGGGEWSELSRLVKFVDPETVLVAQFPPSVSFYQQVESIADTLAKTYNDVGKALNVVRLPVAPDENGEYTFNNNGVVRSYTSSILFNNKILIPSYNSSTDDGALSTYQQVFPGYQVFQIPSQALNNIHGSLFRLGVNVPQPNFLRLRHAQITGMQPYQSEIWINTLAQSITPVDSLQLYYRIHPSTTFQVVNTYGCCGGNSASISGCTISDTISYYLQAFSEDQMLELPVSAPTTTFTFWFDPFTGVQPEINDQQFTISPNPASDYIVCNGIDPADPSATYQIVNMNGIKVAEGKMHNDNSIKLPGYLSNGFYMIKIINFDKTLKSKLFLHR